MAAQRRPRLVPRTIGRGPAGLAGVWRKPIGCGITSRPCSTSTTWRTPLMAGDRWSDKQRASNDDRMSSSPDELAFWNKHLCRNFELGTIYTVIAGLLNILAICDAFAGPVPASTRRKTTNRRPGPNRHRPDGLVFVRQLSAMPEIRAMSPSGVLENGLLGMINQLWYAAPLIVAISLVYAATRHELMEPILAHAIRLGVWIVGFMACIFAVLCTISWWL